MYSFVSVFMQPDALEIHLLFYVSIHSLLLLSSITSYEYII